MATLTITLEASVLEAAKLAAERRQLSLDQLVGEYLSGFASTEIEDLRSSAWVPGVTRELMYAERGRTPGSGEFSEQVEILAALGRYAERHPFRVDLSGLTREDLHERR